MKKYKADLVDEIEPAVNELIERAQQGLNTLYKKESALQTKVIYFFPYELNDFFIKCHRWNQHVLNPS